MMSIITRQEIQDGNGNVILEKGLIVPQDFTFTYTDAPTGTEFIISSCTDPVTNQEYEDLILEKKQTIFILAQSISL